jgi:hypothetical protein
MAQAMSCAHGVDIRFDECASCESSRSAVAVIPAGCAGRCLEDARALLLRGHRDVAVCNECWQVLVNPGRRDYLLVVAYSTGVFAVGVLVGSLVL